LKLNDPDLGGNRAAIIFVKIRTTRSRQVSALAGSRRMTKVSMRS
jgi:hypothetical protein